MKRILIFAAALALFISIPFTHAEPPATVVEKDPGYSGDAPDTTDLAQEAAVLAPGTYGAILVSSPGEARVIEAPVFGKADDKDVYKVTVFPGVLFKFKVTPHNGQNIAIQIYDSGGEKISISKWWLKSYNQQWNEKAAGFAEEFVYMQGLNLSHEEDGLTTFYMQVYDARSSWSLPQTYDYSKSRYTIEYTETNMADGQWTVDAPSHLLRAPKLDWNTTYTSYIGYHDSEDCYQLDPAGAVGDRVKITIKPLNPPLDVRTEPYDYYDANAKSLGSNLSALKSTGWMKIGTREYLKEEFVYEYNDGAKGFPNTFEVYPYYAKGQWDANTSFVYFCVNLREGEGRYEVNVSNSAGTGVEPTPIDITTIILPPAAIEAPTPPEVRVPVLPTLPFFLDNLDAAISLVGDDDEEDDDGTVMPRTLGEFKIGDIISDNLRDLVKEKEAKKTFKKLFKRPPNMKKRTHRIVVETIAYKLAPKKVNANREERARKAFELVFKRQPIGEDDFAVVRAIAYSRLKVKAKK